MRLDLLGAPLAAGAAMQRTRTIVVVDDSATMRSFLKFRLEAQGHRVVTLDSPFGVSAVVDQHPPDLVLIDVNMPALRGDQLAHIVRRYILDSCPIVLYSTMPEDQLAALADTCGANGYISKNTDPEQLSDAVCSFLPPP